jgi:flagellar biosynthetic protein FliP
VIRRLLLASLFVLVVPAVVLAATPAAAAPAAAAPAQLSMNVNGVGTVSAPLQIIVLLTLLTFVPAALVMMTSFTRIAIVFHFLRQALGTAEMPSNQMLTGLTLFLTVFIMAPTASRINDMAVRPAMSGQIDMTEAMDRSTRARPIWRCSSISRSCRGPRRRATCRCAS